MKKTLLPWLAAGLLLAGCSGLPTAREMGDMALLRTLGVDPSPAGVAVTGSTGPRARGMKGEGEPALTLSADRASLSAACLAMQGQSDSYVFFGYVDQLLVGQALAEEGVRPVLDYFSQDGSLGLGAQMWLVRGASARDALSAGGEQGVDSRLETLQNDSEMGVANLTRTAGETYTDLLELGCAYVPALSPAGDGGVLLTEAGYGVLKGDTLSGFLEGEAARGLELLAVGHPGCKSARRSGVGKGDLRPDKKRPEFPGKYPFRAEAELSNRGSAVRIPAASRGRGAGPAPGGAGEPGAGADRGGAGPASDLGDRLYRPGGRGGDVLSGPVGGGPGGLG